MEDIQKTESRTVNEQADLAVSEEKTENRAAQEQASSAVSMEESDAQTVNEQASSAVSMEEMQRTVNRVAGISIVGNIILSIFKLIAGIIAHSAAMMSDAIHSASDVFSSIVVIIGVRIASREADEEHPYGHERMECVAAMLLSMVLFMTGLGIGLAALRNIMSGNYGNLSIPGKLALIAAVVSIVTKEAMFWYTKIHATRIDSSALLADAWHHRTDAISSVGALAGIGLARMGYPVMDSIASLLIFLFITKAAYDIFRDAIDKMVDHACDPETRDLLYDCAIEHEGVHSIDRLRTREFGNRIYVDLEITVDGNLTLRAAHEIAEEVHDHIEQRFPKVKHIMVHVNPD